MPDLLQTDPDPTEEARLRALLHRAVDDLDVPPFEDHASIPVTAPAHRSRRAPLLAAAAVLVVAFGGLAWWASGSGERIDTSPAEQVDPFVIEEQGIWRLPNGDSGFEVTEAMESTTRFPQQIAVDDVDVPTKLLAIIPGSFVLADQPDAEPAAPFTEHTTMTLLRGESPAEVSWLEIAGEGNTGYLTFGYVGLNDDEAQAVARSLVEEIDDEVGALTDTARVDAALRSFQPPAGMAPTWNPEDAGIGTGAYDESGPVTSIGLRLDGHGSRDDTTVSIRQTFLPQAVAVKWHRIQTTSSVTAPTTNTNGTPRRVNIRTNLGRGVLVVNVDGVDTVTVITDDGTEITAGNNSESEPLTIQQQLDIINSLRSVDEREFRARLDAAGVPIRDPQDELDRASSSVDRGDATATTVAAPTTTLAGG
ncbi:MAG TPA: hypothetical protein VM734_20990 [Kofleriaceae bacterium]|nr:hypothetical protein [Kofleriaceae bacterium]